MQWSWREECEGGLRGDLNSLKRFCIFFLGSHGRRDEEWKKDEEPCRSVIWNLREEKDRENRKKHIEKYITEKENASEAVIFIPQEVFHSFISDCLLRMAANYFL